MGRVDIFEVSTGALIKRINRDLAKDGTKLVTTRGFMAQCELGDYHTVDVSRNAIIHKHIDIEDLGREIGVLQDYEKLAVVAADPEPFNSPRLKEAASK